jgi:hypothetical protein
MTRFCSSVSAGGNWLAMMSLLRGKCIPQSLPDLSRRCSRGRRLVREVFAVDPLTTR